MTLAEAFERIVILNLDFKTDRRERLTSHLQALGLAQPSDLTWHRAVCGDWTPPPAYWASGNGAWGCLQSHIRAAQDAVHDKLESILILEDDVVFHPHAAEKLETLLDILPDDCAQLYLGGQHLHDPILVTPGLFEPRNVNRTHAFALTKSVLPKYLQHITYALDYFDLVNGTPVGNGFHIDHQLGRAHERKDWPVYAPQWWIAGQDAGASNISGATNPQLWWHWEGNASLLPFVSLQPGEVPTPEDLQRLHFGATLMRGTLTDVGILAAETPEACVKHLCTIAKEACLFGRLPAVAIPADWEFDLTWQAGVLTLTESRSWQI